MNDNSEHGLIFFDGICNLCNHTVQFIIKRDKSDYFRFAALQSDVAKALLKNKDSEETNSLKLGAAGVQDFAPPYSNLNRVVLRGENAVQLNGERINTIVLVENGKTYFRSTAALRIVKRLGGLWSFCYVLIIIPAFIRDFFYSLISKYRYRIWGKQESCMVPDASFTSKFL